MFYYRKNKNHKKNPRPFVLDLFRNSILFFIFFFCPHRSPGTESQMVARRNVDGHGQRGGLGPVRVQPAGETKRADHRLAEPVRPGGRVHVPSVQQQHVGPGQCQRDHRNVSWVPISLYCRVFFVLRPCNIFHQWGRRKYYVKTAFFFFFMKKFTKRNDFSTRR